MGKIYLMRHGFVDKRWRDSFLGRINVALAPAGRERLYQIAEQCLKLNIDCIISSDLARCQETAAIISERLKLPFQVDRRLREINMGKWDGARRQTIRKLYPKSFRRRGNNLWRFRCPGGGESFVQVASRADYLVENLQDFNGNCLLVTHAGVIRSLAALYGICRFSPRNNLKVNYGEIIMLSADDQGKISYTLVGKNQ